MQCKPRQTRRVTCGPARPDRVARARAVKAFLILTLAGVVACGSDYGLTSPAGGGGGPAGSVTVGSGIQFVSRHNGSMNPAVDTIASGDTVTWSWSGGLPHGVRSVGSSTFPNSATMMSGTYRVAFPTPGIYRYECSVHGQAMTGTIVVLGTTSSTQSVTDPIGDTFERDAGKQWDLSALTVTRDTNGVVVRLDFVNEIVLPTSGDSLELAALVEFDLDQNPATGHRAVVDVLRADGGSTGMGVDAGVDLVTADSTVIVHDALGHETGRGKAEIGGHRITLHIPRAAIGNDDGFVDAAVIVGNGHDATDVAPQQGRLRLGAPARVVAPAAIVSNG